MAYISTTEELKEIGLFDVPLQFPNPKNIPGWTEVTSRGWEQGVTYSMSCSDQRCNCPDFSKMARQEQQKNQLGRLCKHLVHGLNEIGAFNEASFWVQLLVSTGERGPFAAVEVRTLGAKPALLVVRGDSGWIDFYARTTRKGENAGSATGNYRRYGWSINEKRWVHGDYPRGGPLFRNVIERIESISLNN